MDEKESIRQSIKKISGHNAPDRALALVNKADTFYATVDSVDIPNRTCACTLVSGITDLNLGAVKLMAVLDDGQLLVPAIDSTVIIETMNNIEPMVKYYSELQKVDYIVGDTEVSMVDGEVSILQADMQITLSAGKISIKNGSKDLFTLIKNIVTHAMTAAYVNSGGAALADPTTTSNFNQDLSDLSDLMQ